MLSLLKPRVSASLWQAAGLMGKSKKAGQSAQLEEKSLQKEEGPVCLSKQGEIRIAILAKPGAKVSAVTGVDVEGVGVQIAARPVDGEANAELVSFVASVLGLKKNEICLDRGSKSRQKILIVSSPTATVDSVLLKLKVAVEK